VAPSPSQLHPGVEPHDAALHSRTAETSVSATSLPGSLHTAPLAIGRLTVELLTVADLPALQALRERVLHGLQDPDDYRPETDETRFLRAHFNAPHLCLGIKAHSHVVAYGMLDFPPTHAAMQRHGRHSDDIGTMCETTPQLISCMVDSDFRGLGLQRYLINARLDVGWQRGASRFWAMVAPGNHVSRANLHAAGFLYLATRDFDGHARHIMMLNHHHHRA
jgi:GNAT superfamily N-acetyltransferase